MHTQKQLSALLFGSLLVTIFSLGYHEKVTAAEPTAPVSFACLPKTPPIKKGEATSFSLVRNIPPVFTCTIKNNSSDQEFSGFLLGKSSADQGTPVATSATVAIKKNATTETTLEFPAVLHSGTYRYVFTLFDTTNKKPLASEYSVIGILEGDQQAKITAVTLDADHYEWSSPLTLTVSIALPEDTALANFPLALTVGLQNQQGELCATLTENQFPSQTKTTLKLKFPEQGNCTNALVVLLKNKNGAPIDQKVVAVPLPKKQTITPTHQTSTSLLPVSSDLTADIPRGILIFLTITAVLLSALVGYFFLRRK